MTLRRWSEALPFALLLLLATLALAQSWNRWLDPIIDTGRDLYVSEEIAHGTKLYRDVRYQYPPLAPYALAALTSALGSSLAAFTAIGIAQSAAIAALLWLALGRIAGFAAALFFVALSFTGASTWGANFIFPYAYAATIGMLFLVAALFAFLRERHAWAIASLVAASWCKVEYAAGAALIIAILTAVRRLRMRDAGTYAAAMAGTALLAFLYFGPPLRENIFAASLTRGAIAGRFFRNVSGLAAWPRSLVLAVASAAAIALLAWLVWSRSKFVIPAMVVAALFFNSDSFFRGWALLQFAALAIGLRNRASPLVVLAAFSVAATLRVALNISPQWYGCVLIVPVYALAAYVLFADDRFKSPWWIIIVATICVRDLAEQRARYSMKAFPIQSSRGVFFDANEDRARVLNELIRTVRGPTLAVVPEGASLNYLTRTSTPVRFYMFTPPETADPEVEQQVIREFQARRPAEVAVVSRNVGEYGFRGFGVDYDQRLMAYLIHTYGVTRSWKTGRFECLLLGDMSR